MESRDNSRKRMRELFSDYFDGEVSAADRSTFEQLLEEDAVFRSEYESYASLFNQVRALPSIAVSDSFETRLRAKIRQESPPKNTGWWADFGRIPLPVPLGAAALVLVGVFSYGMLTPPSPSQVPVTATPSVLSEPVAGPDRGESTEPQIVTNTRPVFAPHLSFPGIGTTVGAGLALPAPNRASSPHQYQRDDYGTPLEGPFRYGTFRTEGPRTSGVRTKAAAGAVDTSRTE
ncbi:MAG: hypothetical protein HKN20_18170 [Gemmatimonadetes bacterium]|nr:hypothetical protein [Gemmatimonadota bacterium]